MARIDHVRDSDGLVSIGFLVTFLFGGLTGVILASPGARLAGVSDSYFVVAHFHYVDLRNRRVRDVRRVLLLVAEVDGKDAQREASDTSTSGCCSSASTSPSSSSTGSASTECLVATPTTCRSDGFTWRTEVSTVGSMILGLSMVPFFWNVWITSRKCAEGHRQRPLGLRRFAGVGNVLPTSTTQLHVDAAHSFGASGIRREPPGVARIRRTRHC